MNHYDYLLRKSFEESVPGWNTLSDLDPMKVMVEAIGSSLEAVEQRQGRLTETMVASFPALFGFSAKAAAAAQMLFKVKVNSRLDRTLTVTPEHPFSFSAPGGRLRAEPVQAITILPVYEESVKEHKSGWEVVFRSRAALNQLSLCFAPALPLEKGPRLRRVQLEIRRAATDERVVLSAQDFKVNDDTRGFARAGRITISGLHEGKFIQAEDAVRVLIDCEGTRPDSWIGLNLFIGAVRSVLEMVDVGVLRGESWEVVNLPESIMECPEQLQLRFPDDRQMTVYRLSDELLRVREEEPATFAAGYFYHGGRHQLIFPAADQLIGGFNGAVSVRATQVVCGSPESTVGTANTFVNEDPKHLEVVEPVSLLSPFLPREPQTSYLSRFYAEMKLFSKLALQRMGVSFEEVANEVVGCDPRIRSVEYELDAKTNEVVFFVLCGDPQAVQLGEIEDEIYGKVARVLNAHVPLAFRWAVRPYFRTPVTLTGDLVTEDKRESVLTNRIDQMKSSVRELLAVPPFGTAAVGTPITVEYLKGVLSGNDALRAFALQVGEEREFRNSLTRRPGEIFDFELKLHCRGETESYHG